MAKQVQVRYVYNAGAFECRDITVGCVYDAELPSFGEVDKDGEEVQCYDELWITKDDAGDAIVTRLSVGFELVEEQDDPLPPAPESVLYIGLQQHVHRRLQVKVFKSADGGSVVDLHIGGGMLGDGKSCVLAPDAALQLAHDLNRMANEIKRKGKQNA